MRGRGGEERDRVVETGTEGGGEVGGGKRRKRDLMRAKERFDASERKI